jgi:hypothetical protein
MYEEYLHISSLLRVNSCNEEFCLLGHNAVKLNEVNRFFGGIYRLHLQVRGVIQGTNHYKIGTKIALLGAYFMLVLAWLILRP